MDGFHHQFHQAVHFRLRPVPVLLGEGVEGKILHSRLHGGFGAGADALHPFHVPIDAFFAPGFRPAPVAVHDDGDVLRYVVHTIVYPLFLMSSPQKSLDVSARTKPDSASRIRFSENCAISTWMVQS